MTFRELSCSYEAFRKNALFGETWIRKVGHRSARPLQDPAFVGENMLLSHGLLGALPMIPGQGIIQN